MKKNKTILMLTIILATMLSSCSHSDDMPEINNEQNKAIFTGAPSTRVAGASWAEGDQIGVTMFNSGFTDIISTYKNFRYDANTSGTYTTFTQKSGDMYFPAGNIASFAAYYPYKSDGTYEADHHIRVYDGSEDVMYAKQTAWNTQSRGKEVEFNFKYVLAKVIVKIVSGTGSPSIAVTNMHMEGSDYYAYQSGTLNLKTGLFDDYADDGSNFGYFSPTGVENEYYTLLIPQTMPDGITLWIGTSSSRTGVDFSNKVFEAKEYTYTITLNNGTAKVGSSSITNRTTGTGGAMTADI